MELREYQKEAVDVAWETLFKKQTVLLVGSTGVGKTEISIGIIKKCLEKYPTFKCVFLVNRVKLLDQTQKRLSKHLGDIVGVFCASKNKKDVTRPITVASIQSIKNTPVDTNIVFIDEVHAIDESKGRYFEWFALLREKNPKIKFIGMSATPFSSRGYLYGKDKFFDVVDFERGLLWSIENKFLVPPRIKFMAEAFDTDSLRIRAGEWRTEDVERLVGDELKIRRQIDDALVRLQGRKKVVWACSSINHAVAVHRLLTLIKEPTAIIHSKQEDIYQELNMESFEQGSSRHLVFITIVSEGYDYPPIDAVVLMRPTRSPNLYVQTIGRGLRPYGDKINCLVLDYGRVVENCGPLDNPIIRTGRDKNKVEKSDMKFCPQCLEYCDIKDEACPICGYNFKKPKELDLKNLTDSACEASILTDNKPKIYDVIKIEIVKHKSKAGNDCAKIVYTTTNLSNRCFWEFFSIENAYAFGLFKKRLSAIGIETFSDKTFASQLFVQDKNIVIHVIKDGKYNKITKVITGE